MLNKVCVLFLSVAVAGCANTKSPKPQHPEVKKENSEIRNKKCVNNIKRIEVVNTLDKTHALVHYYTKGDEKRPRIGMLSSIADNILLYDELELKVPEEQCIIIKDTFTYENKEIGKKTGPIITFEYKNLPKNDEELQKRIKRFVHNLKKNICNNDNPEISKVYKDVEQCKCYFNYMRQSALSYQDQVEKATKEIAKLKENGVKDAAQQVAQSHVKNLMNRMEAKCGAIKKTNTQSKPVSKTVILDGKPVTVGYNYGYWSGL